MKTLFPLMLYIVGIMPASLASLEPCKEESNAELPFCNTSLPFTDRANDLVSRLTRDEKIAQLVNDAASIDRLNIDAYHWWSECLHGISGDCTSDGRCPTIYPSPIGIGASFNVNLVKKMGSQISTEARRMFSENHLHTGNDRWQWMGLDYWAPNINIFRDPRWGRGLETPGEDPYLNGQYAIHFVRGMQEGEDPRYFKTVATLKHYAAYSVENWKGFSRFSFDAIVSDEDLAQTYLPAFEAGIKEGRAGSVMCSYNSVNSIPSCSNSFLLQDILRDEWDWDGYVVSDCDAIGNSFTDHRYKPTAEEAAAVALKAGTDLDCGSFYSHLTNATAQGLASDDDLDKALLRLFTTRFKLGMFDPWEEQPYLQYPPDALGHPDHVETALQLARESIVLLKNEDAMLPLDPRSIGTLALLGPNFNATRSLCGNYFRDTPRVTSPLEGIGKAFGGKIKTSLGCKLAANDKSGFDEAVKTAESADVAILFMGIDSSIEGEGRDRVDIGLPGVQEDFIEAISKVQKKTILVLTNGGSLDISAAKNNPSIPAIVEAFYPGMTAGNAIADVLFGAYNPSGRLPYTMHHKDFVDQIPMVDMSMSNFPGRTYRYFRGESIYPFGFGLSYTSFEYETEEVEQISFTNGGGTRYRVKVTNSGKVAGDTSVLGFISFGEKSTDFSCPLSQLFAFDKIHLSPGESKEIFFSASPLHLLCYSHRDKALNSPHGLYKVQIEKESFTFAYGETNSELTES